jgi:hypothetical protein
VPRANQKDHLPESDVVRHLQQKREVKSGGTRIHGDNVRHAKRSGQLFLEGKRFRTHSDPTGAHHARDSVDFLARKVGFAERQVLRRRRQPHVTFKRLAVKGRKKFGVRPIDQIFSIGSHSRR